MLRVRFSRDDLDRLFYVQPKSAVPLLLIGMVLSFFLVGFFAPYWRVADQDLILAYQGLLFTDNLPQDYFDHTGYLSYLFLGGWYRFLHWLGLLPVHALSELPPAHDSAAFDAAWQGIVSSGRVLSLLLAASFVLVFVILVRRIFGDWRLAILAGYALAYSGGVSFHMRVLRTELISAGLTTTGLLLVLAAAWAKDGVRRYLFLFSAGLCSALAVSAKVQALVVLLVIPVVALVLGREPEAEDRRDATGRAWLWAMVLGGLALAAAWPTLSLLEQGIADAAKSMYGYRPLGIGPAGTYQALIAAWIAATMIVYAAVWRRRAAEVVAAMAAIMLGVSLGLLSLHIRFDEQNLIAVANPIEHMFALASWGTPDLAQAKQLLDGSFLRRLGEGLMTALAAHTFVLHPSDRPTLILEWLSIAGGVWAWRQGDRKLPFQIAVLLLVVWALDAVFTLRQLKHEYFVYTDPLLIIAALLTAVRFSWVLDLPRVRSIAPYVVAIYVIAAHQSPVKILIGREGPETSCNWHQAYLKRVERFPFCNS